MAQSFADYYGIDPKVFEKTGALDPILEVDTRLFIDPVFLKLTKVPELSGSYEKVLRYFVGVLKVIRNIKAVDDRLWRQADLMLTFPEIKGLCIGYATKGTSGSGMGPAIRHKLLDSITQIVSAGVDDPVIFEIVGAFEDDVGPDRISDMVAKIIIDDLIAFTQRVCRDCKIPMVNIAVSKGISKQDLPINPVTNLPVILVPKELLNDLPVADSYSDIQYIASRNAEIRDALNNIIGTSWRDATIADRKEATRRTFIHRPDVLVEILNAYRNAAPDRYDFNDDRSGEVIWYRAANEIAQTMALKLELSKTPDANEIESVALTICNHFKRLIENNQLCDLLYDKGGNRKHESAAQLLFFGIADAYCSANDLDLSPESDSGRGPVDFKFSRGYKGRVLVEVKLTSNPKLEQGFTKQLPIYQDAENAPKGIYLVIDNGGATEARLKRFHETIRDAGPNAPKVIWVDGVQRPSASIAKDK